MLPPGGRAGRQKVDMFTLKASASCKHAVRPSVCYFTLGRCHSSLGDIIQECQDSDPQLSIMRCRTLTTFNINLSSTYRISWGMRFPSAKVPRARLRVTGRFARPRFARTALMFARPSVLGGRRLSLSPSLRRALRCHAAPSLGPSVLQSEAALGAERTDGRGRAPSLAPRPRRATVCLSRSPHTQGFQRFPQVQSYALLKNPLVERD